jgi:hypothetical protein
MAKDNAASQHTKNYKTVCFVRTLFDKIVPERANIIGLSVSSRITHAVRQTDGREKEAVEIVTEKNPAATRHRVLFRKTYCIDFLDYCSYNSPI